MRKVIINSTPLIALSKINQLELLRKMYGEIYIPEAVYREVTRKNDIAKKQIQNNDWIHVTHIKNFERKRMYSAKLHDGEVEVMILAEEYGAEHLVVIDDNSARKTAEFLGLNLTGTIGILIKAKRKGLINFVMPYIESMKNHGIYFSEQLMEQIKRISQE